MCCDLEPSCIAEWLSRLDQSITNVSLIRVKWLVSVSSDFLIIAHCRNALSRNCKIDGVKGPS